MDIEEILTWAVKNLISKNLYLKLIISDKVSIWDWDVFVYGTKDRNKKNKNLVGRVPVQ